MKNKGYTLVELLIAIAIAGIVLVSIFGAVLSGCGSDWEKAERDAKTFAANIPGSTGRVQCAKKDTDKDGYCGCTVFMKDAMPLAIDCGCERFCWNCAEGCKIVNPGKGLRTNVRVRSERE